MSASQPAWPTLFSSFVLWIAIAGAIAPVAYFIAMAVLFTYYKTYREPGWGSNREAFPLLIVTHDPAGEPVANIVSAGDLGRFSNYTFNIRKSERAQIERQLDALRQPEKNEPAPGRFEILTLDVDDRPDGTQQIHLNASQYDDSIHESWYIVQRNSIRPLYHRHNVGIGVGIAAALGSVIPAAIASLVISGAIVVLRYRARGRMKPAPHT